MKSKANAVNLEFWGVRGTVPVSDRNKRKYGGNTPCASLKVSEQDWIVVDAGTGLRKLGDKLINPLKKESFSVHLFLTHFHLDHIMGLPFFAPLYSSKAVLFFYAACSPGETEKYLRGLMSGRYFPLEFQETPSKKIYKEVHDDFAIGDARIFHCALQHPQGSVGYKIQVKEKSVVFATDTEHPKEGVDEMLVSFVQGTDLLVYDSTFTPEEYEAGRAGWGHSTWREGIKVAKKAKVRTLYLSHFNPDHSDKQIEEIISLARKEFPRTYGAKEGGSVVF